MCGIAGLLHRDGRPVDRAVLAAMTAALAHRGPDGDGLWLDGPVGFGHRRLAIRDLSETGRQPISDAGGRVVVVYNGELYNEDELRAGLARDFGAAFRSTCDAEVLPYGWLAWGERLVERLEGMFAFALWDRERRVLVLARDHVGIKPLYLAEDDGGLRFASEIKGLLADPRQQRRIDAAGLPAFLAQGYVGPERTLLAGVRQVAPGGIECHGAATRSARRYYEIRRRPEIRDPAAALEGFLELWPGVVRRHLVSDVPVGVLQSGGIDSTLVSLALPRDAAVNLYTAAFSDPSHDETAVASAVADIAGRAHRIVAADRAVDAEGVFRAVVRQFDGQLADSSAFAAYVLSAAVRREVPVVLGGDGGDELFGGYPTYRASRLAACPSRLVPRALADLGARALRRLGGEAEARLPWTEVLGRFIAGLGAPAGTQHAEWRRLLPADMVDALYGPALDDFKATDGLAGYRAALAGGGALVDRCLAADQAHYLPSDLLLKVDGASMAHGLEVRVPLLDRQVIDFAGRLHADLLTPLLGPDKRILRQAARRFGAPEAAWRGRKRGFNLPVARLLRRDLAALGRRLLELEPDTLAPYLAPDAVRGLWRQHAAGEANHGYLLWLLLTFAVWRRELSDGG